MLVCCETPVPKSVVMTVLAYEHPGRRAVVVGQAVLVDNGFGE
jgi:hypothetical protein